MFTLQVFSQFADIRDHVSLHLVEISPKLSQLQAERLTNGTTEATTAKMNNYGESINGETLGPYRQEISKYGQKVFWYRALEDVPSGLSFFIGHEFLDALPIHKFQVWILIYLFVCLCFVLLYSCSGACMLFHRIVKTFKTLSSIFLFLIIVLLKVNCDKTSTSKKKNPKTGKLALSWKVTKVIKAVDIS